MAQAIDDEQKSPKNPRLDHLRQRRDERRILAGTSRRGQRSEDRPSHTPAPAENPPRHPPRRSGAPAPPSDPIATYAARSANGLTDKEIGWIIGDFKTAGLDLGVRVASQEEYLAQRQAQDRWYRDALVEAWSFPPGQAAQVTAKLAELFDQEKADFIEALAAGPKPFKHNGQWFTVTSSEPIRHLIDANRRLQDAVGRYLPSNLCEMRDPSDRLRNIDIKITGIPEQAYESVTLAEPIQIATAEPSMITVDLVLPKTNPPPNIDPTAETLTELGILPQLRKLHPAQLKLLLLIDPNRTREVESALESTR